MISYANRQIGKERSFTKAKAIPQRSGCKYSWRKYSARKYSSRASNRDVNGQCVRAKRRERKLYVSNVQIADVSKVDPRYMY